MCLNFSNLKGNHFTFAFFLAVLLSTISAQPGKTDWWLDPCVTQLSQMRHARSAGTRQLSISINYMNDLKKKLSKIHPNYSGKCPPKYGKCLKLRGLIQQVRKTENKLAGTTQFYISLSQLAMFLEKLRNVPINYASNKFKQQERNQYYEQLKSNIQLSLCEASYDINQLAPNKKNVLIEEVTKLTNKSSKCIPHKMNVTTAQINDICFFEKINKFLKQSRNHLRKLSRKRHSGAKRNQRKKKRTKKL